MYIMAPPDTLNERSQWNLTKPKSPRPEGRYLYFKGSSSNSRELMTAQDTVIPLQQGTEEALKELYMSAALPQDVTQTLVLSYLVHNCYASTVHSLQTTEGSFDCQNRDGDVTMETKSSLEFSRHSTSPMETLELRKKLFEALVAGRVTEAIALYDGHFGSLAAKNSVKDLHIEFLLSGQVFIELIRQGSASALEYANLGPLLRVFNH